MEGITCIAAFAVMCARLLTQPECLDQRLWSFLAALHDAKVPPEAPADEWQDGLRRARTILQFPWQVQ